MEHFKSHLQRFLALKVPFPHFLLPLPFIHHFLKLIITIFNLLGLAIIIIITVTTNLIPWQVTMVIELDQPKLIIIQVIIRLSIIQPLVKLQLIFLLTLLVLISLKQVIIIIIIKHLT